MPQVKQRKARPVKVTSYTQSYGVKESLVWPTPGDKKRSSLQREKTDTFVLPRKGGVGEPNTRGYEYFDHLATARNNPEDDYHVIDALRGWPQRAGEAEGLPEGGEGQEDVYRETSLEREARYRAAGVKKTKKKATGNKPKKTNRRCATGLEGGDGPDPHIADLLSHRFLTESELERVKVKKEAEEAARSQARLEYERKFPKNFKGTKASQLRSIALGEKVAYDPKNLWQMSKFKNKAEPTLDTFRKRGGGNGHGKEKIKKGVSYFDGKQGDEGLGIGGEETSKYERPVEDILDPELEFTTDVYDDVAE